jgi:hypothetical protein
LRIFKTKVFARFANKERISDTTLCEAVERAEMGLIDADLGGYVIKQRVNRDGQGRSKGHRVIIAFISKKRSFFLHGFSKNDKDNLSDDELEMMKCLAYHWLNYNEKNIQIAIKGGELKEVKNEKKIESGNKNHH